MPSLAYIASVLAIVAYTHVASCAPVPSPQFTEFDDAYSGEGGTADGGSVVSTANSNNKGLLGGVKLLSAFSHNAGAGGQGSSGFAAAGPANSTVSNNAVNSLVSSPGGTNVLGSGYTGKGGSASGGNVMSDESGGLIELFNGNAGKAGDAASGGVGGVPVTPQAKAKTSFGPKAPMSPALPLLRIIRARMDMD